MWGLHPVGFGRANPAEGSAATDAVKLSVCLLLIISAIVGTRGVANAQNLTSAPMIFDVRKSLPLEPDEPAYHDFYINAGPEAGFKKGQFVTAVRLIPVHDPVQNKQQATLTVNVAKLQIIHVERNITVARLLTEFTDDERPTLEYESIMIGDRIDPTSLTMDAPAKKKAKPKATASQPAPDGATAAALLTTPPLAPAPVPSTTAAASAPVAPTAATASSAGAPAAP